MWAKYSFTYSDKNEAKNHRGKFPFPHILSRVSLFSSCAKELQGPFRPFFIYCNKTLFCLFNQLLFWLSCCHRRCGILKSLVSCSALFKAFLDLISCKQGIWFVESEKFLLVESGILGFRIHNTAQEPGIALNRTWKPESKFHWQRLESSTWNHESPAWNP